METDPKALEKVRLVIQVQSGQMTATEAASKMGMSRKTYYKWEKRCLEAMVNAAGEKYPGRPSPELDPEKERLKSELETLKDEVLLLEQKLHIREALKAAEDESLAREKKG